MEKKLRIDRTRRVKDILWILAFFGVVAMVFRFAFGLGETTNLSDRVPWGLWKILNMVGGAALATSGFTIGFLGHVLHIKKLERLVKPAILVAFLGYGSSLFALLFDIGLPWRFWHPFVHWNMHSFLFEVFWCVSIYFCITFVELSPILLERIGLSKLRGVLHKASTIFVIAGITLSSMHHTSLGALFLVSPQRLHELWFSPIISLLFIISAMGGGMLMLVLIKVLHSRWYDPKRLFINYKDKSDALECKACEEDEEYDGKEAPDMPSIRLLASIASGVLGFYFLLKMGDLLLRDDAINALFAGTWESWLYVAELSIGVVIPIILIWLPSIRKSPVGLAVASGFAGFGLALNRMDVGIFGYFRDAKEIYFPSAIEWAITLGVVSMAGLAFFFIAENFSVFNSNWKLRGERGRKITSSFDRLTFVWNHRLLTGFERNTIIAVAIVPLAFILLYPPFYADKTMEVRPPVAVDLMRDTLRLDGNREGFSTVFAHTAHQEKLGGEASCNKCHHLSLPQDQATSCTFCHTGMESKTTIFDHNQHMTYVAQDKQLSGLHPENQSCTQCHPAGQAKTVSNAMGCLECHDKDMKAVNPPMEKMALRDAPSYHVAMHGMCIQCHQAEAANFNNPNLGDCNTCHQNVQNEEMQELVMASSK